MEKVQIPPLSAERFEKVLEPDPYREFISSMAGLRGLLAGQTLWNVNSTSQGGGVAEMLAPLLGYQTGVGIDAHWLVIEGDHDFFDLTKRIHNLLHGDPGDGQGLSDSDRAAYESTLQRNLGELEALVRPGDVVILHDPQTIGLAPALREAGAKVIWSCHVGTDEPDDNARAAWDFLQSYVDATEIHMFTRPSYAWEGLEPDRLAIVAPCIDAFSPKNQDLEPQTVAAILEASGVVPEGSGEGEPAFERPDGKEGRVSRTAEMLEDESLPQDAPIVVQVSRWDRLKDPVGVLEGFARHVPEEIGAHLVLAGPEVGEVTDDPEEDDVLREVKESREALPAEARARAHLALLPMEDLEENAAIVNALQRRADVIVQKSLAEGFGLTVAEGMWKGRPTVASKVGGIQDQIVHDESGLLVEDPEDLESFGSAVAGVLEDGDKAQALGRRARERVRDEYLAPRYLTQLAELVERLLA